MVEVIGQCGINLSAFQMRVVEEDFAGRPAVIEVISDNLRNANSRQPLQARRLTIRFFDVRIRDVNGHTSSPNSTVKSSIPHTPQCFIAAKSLLRLSLASPKSIM